MRLLLLVTILSFAGHLAAIPVFEATFAILLLSPIFLHLLGVVGLPTGVYSYYAIIAVLFIAVAILCRLTPGAGRQRRTAEEWSPVLVFLGAFSVFHFLTHLWPDFVSIGERLRDYAILSSVIQSPVDLKEPWMSGYPLNYYAYWYQLGAMFAKVLHLPTWSVYHNLQSFTYALFFTAAFHLFHAHLRFAWWQASIGAVVISIGSNISGFVNWWTRDGSWWGPSRVLKGAIDEFPAWSFLLGDVHPHYLGLPLIPFWTLVALRLLKSGVPFWDKLAYSAMLALLLPIWIYNGNAWEIPAWTALVFSVLCLLAIKPRHPWRGALDVLRDAGRIPFGRLMPTAILYGAAVAALYFLSKGVPSSDYGWKLIRSPVERTTIEEMGLHFGLPLLVITGCLLRVVPQGAMRALVLALVFAWLFVDLAVPFLLAVFGLNLARIWSDRKLLAEDGVPRWPDIVIEAMGLVALTLIIVCEITYLDDPYGADIERMNTIFKFYAAAWFPLHAFAIFLLARAVRAKLAEPATWWVGIPLEVAVVTCMTLFFFRTIGMRVSPPPTVLPSEQGLTSVELQFPGAATTIKTLYDQPRGTVLEGQGRPYDWTTHVATLSGHTAYLGWANHVNLLTRAYGEVERREKMTEAIYLEPACDRKRTMLRLEGISYVVVGPLERQKYPAIDHLTFECLRKMVENGEYRVYATM